MEVRGHCSFEDSSKRAIMLGYRDTWALQFPSQQAFDSFVTEYKEKLAENTSELGSQDAQEDAQQTVTTPETQTEMEEDLGQPDKLVNGQPPDIPIEVNFTSLNNSWVLKQNWLCNLCHCHGGLHALQHCMDRRANLKISSVQDQPHSNSPDFISDNQQQVQGVSSFSACFASQRLATFELLMQCEVA